MAVALACYANIMTVPGPVSRTCFFGQVVEFIFSGLSDLKFLPHICRFSFIPRSPSRSNTHSKHQAAYENSTCAHPGAGLRRHIFFFLGFVSVFHGCYATCCQQHRKHACLFDEWGWEQNLNVAGETQPSAAGMETCKHDFAPTNYYTWSDENIHYKHKLLNYMGGQLYCAD